MIVTLAGRRIDAPNAQQARFPLKKSPAVYGLLQQLFKEQQATTLVSSAACGADLLALDAAGRLGIRRRVVLSFEPEQFRTSSVADRPGDWGTLYDRIIREVQAAGDLVILHETTNDAATYMRANLAILDEAQKLAREEAGPDKTVPDEILAVLVWEGSPRSSDDITAAFGAEARARAMPIVEILTR